MLLPITPLQYCISKKQMQEPLNTDKREIVWDLKFQFMCDSIHNASSWNEVVEDIRKGVTCDAVHHLGGSSFNLIAPPLS